MPSPSRYYSSTAAKTTLSSAIDSGSTSLQLAAASGLPSQYPYTLILEKDTANEEIVEVTGLIGSAYQITRNIDNSGAKAHSIGALVEHGVSARDFSESRTHEVATTAHGVTGDIVGTTGAQTITGKTLTTTTLGSDLAAGGYKITGLATPTSSSDAATKSYIDTQTTSAAASASSAAVSASSAATSASSALTSQASAAVSASSAATSATAAATSAASAATSATAAATSAASALTSQTAAATSAASALTSQTAAATSATSASASATAAATSATSAAASATTAANSVATIAGYVTTASNSAAAASTSAASAATSATAAATSATSAAASATAAAGSATTASNSAATATTSAAQAATSASSAATSATAAATSASSAATSATAAATSASSAATSASSAATSYDNFDDRYLGPKATAPSVDNDGDPLLEGALYWNSTNKNMNVWNGTAWEVVTTSGDITAVNAGTGITGGGASGAVTVSLDTSSVYVVPSQTGNSGKFLTTNGTTSSWGVVAGALAQPNEPASPSDGQIWIDTDGTAPTTVVTRWTKQPAAGTTSLTGNDDYSIPLAYSAGYEQVFLNGVLLSRSGGEYTATNGTSITLTSATVAGDIVEVICPLQIATTDTYTQSAVNNAFQANTNNFTAGKNKIINGDFNINQRNFSSTTTSNTYGHDRWQGAWSGGTVTYSNQTFTLGTAPVAGYEAKQYARLVTSGQSAAGDLALFYQPVESVRTFAGQTTTYSFWAKASSGTPKMALELEQSFGSGGSPSSVLDTYVNQVTLSTSWQRYSVTFTVPSISGKTLGTNNNDAAYVLMWTSAGTNYNARTGSLGIQNTTIDIWGCQWEAGSNATAFQTATGSIQGELAACQRYYYRNTTNASQYGFLGTGYGWTTGIGRCIIPLPVPMRIIPTTIDTSAMNTFYWETATTGFTTPTSITDSGNSSLTTSVLNFNKVSGFTAATYYAYYSFGTSAYIGLSAEL